jgi:hypothetical protein
LFLLAKYFSISEFDFIHEFVLEAAVHDHSRFFEIFSDFRDRGLVSLLLETPELLLESRNEIKMRYLFCCRNDHAINSSSSADCRYYFSNKLVCVSWFISNLPFHKVRLLLLFRHASFVHTSDFASKNSPILFAGAALLFRPFTFSRTVPCFPPCDYVYA